MLLGCIIYAICVNIDSFNVGLSYGIKNIQVKSFFSKSVLFITSLVLISISVLLGYYFSNLFSEKAVDIFGCSIICLMGFWMLYQALRSKEKKEYKFNIKFLDITIKIIRNPSSSDLDNSKLIDPKEAFYLSFALSIDAMAVALGGNIKSFCVYIYPILATILQLVALFGGGFLVKKIKKLSHIPEHTWGIIAGCILIFIGFIRMFF